MDLFLFSGLGADKRAYQYLDFSDHTVNHIEWVPPIKGESIALYAKRLSKEIKSAQPVLIGLSFGGLMAIEVAKHIETHKVILISSVKTNMELPTYYKLIGRLGLYKIMPRSRMTKPDRVFYWLFGLKRTSDKKLLADIMNDSDTNFVKWAIHKMTNWNNNFIPNNVIHIHGSKDRIFPIGKIQADIVIKDGGHFMTVDKSEELSLQIRKQLN